METFTSTRRRSRTDSVPEQPGHGAGSGCDADDSRTHRARRAKLSGRFLLPVATTLTLLVAGETLAQTRVLPTELSSPTDIARWLVGQTGVPDFWISVGHTLQHTLLGLLFGSVAGILLGLVMGQIPILHRLFQGTFEFLRPIPVIVYLPLFILMWGAVAKTAVVLVAVAAIWPMLYQTMYGVRAVDALLTDAGRVFGLTHRQRLVNITIPSISPFLATGLRISLSIALVVSVAIELIAGVPGLGWSLTQYQTAGNHSAVYGIVVVTGTLGLLLNSLALGLEKRALHWHVSNRNMKA